MVWKRVTITFLSVIALWAFSVVPAMASKQAYFGARTGAGSGNATLWRYDHVTNTVSSVEPGLDQVTAIDADQTHVYAGLDIPGNNPGDCW